MQFVTDWSVSTLHRGSIPVCSFRNAGNVMYASKETIPKGMEIFLAGRAFSNTILYHVPISPMNVWGLSIDSFAIRDFQLYACLKLILTYHF